MAKKKQKLPAWEMSGDSLAARKEREHKAIEGMGYRKVDDLEAQADQFLLNADREMLLAISQNVQALRDGLEALKLPSNDPEYLRRLQVNDAQRNAIAARLTQIDLVADGGKIYIGVGSFLPHVAEELGRQLATHFETKLRKHD